MTNRLLRPQLLFATRHCMKFEALHGSQATPPSFGDLRFWFSIRKRSDARRALPNTFATSSNQTGTISVLAQIFLRPTLVLLALLSWPLYKTMEVSGSFSLVLVNPASEKQFADLG